MAEFPLPPMHSKCLLKSAEFECSEEIVTIVAMMQIQDVFVTPFRYNLIFEKLNQKSSNFSDPATKPTS